MENKIIKLIKKKEPRSVDYIVDLYSDKVSYIVNTILKGYSNKEDVEECINDVFLAVCNDIDNYESKKGKFETFIFIKAKYIALDYKRRIIKKREQEKIKEIIAFIKNFKEPDKTYFYLKYFINLEAKDIAKKYNTTLSSVENRLYRCRRAIKDVVSGGV